MENLEMKRKKEQKDFDLPEPGFEPQIFSYFPAHDLSFHVKWGKEVGYQQEKQYLWVIRLFTPVLDVFHTLYFPK